MLRQRPNGCKFRRQHPIGPYILDFFCDAVSLAVEVDGPSHSQAAQAAHDARRTSWLGRQGISVLRIAAEDVRFRPQDVLTAITTRCPPPQGEVPRRGGGGFAATAAPVEEPHP